MTPDLVNLVDSWPKALVAIVLILALLVWPGMMAWLQAKRSAVAVHKVQASLSTPNGGSSVRDALNRIEKGQGDQGKLLVDALSRVAALEDTVGKHHPSTPQHRQEP